MQQTVSMSLEEDIRQTTFRNEHQKGMINMIYTCNWIMERQKKILGREKITPQQFNILRILRGAYPKPISTMQIRERMLDKMSDTSRIVDRLTVKGLANKKTCLTDKRLVDIAITPRGMAMLERLDRRNEEMDALLRALPEPEVKMLNQLLDKIRKPE
ncbi:MarR family transcriptional regulator [Agriterribacter sp.]|uniref:MarR family winged helix-turn-helix transcriptional regulator n=1 Tax=Agriterribacter sp. TaxID=2821509 RepID=UPI002C059F79|nr:MarR family transcriptional regulator [Agriterribacter sp.]HRO48491.1 MarR family transcriptional regulator [Agriterribacter sp.]HRQ17158.1 MarR family transcriptional regulator [Agriterribacter sp.]